MNYNSYNILFTSVFKSIESALDIDYPTLDVVVIDNGSSDGSFEAIRDRFGNDILLIRLDRNYGYTGGNELGLERYVVHGGWPEYSLFMNNDFIVTNKELVKTAIRFFKTKNDVMLAQGLDLNENGKYVDNAGYFMMYAYNKFIKVGRYNGLRPSDCLNRSSYITNVDGSCFISRTKKIKELRGYIFNKRFFAFHDEAELGWYLWSQGLKSVFMPTIAGIHQGSRSFGRASNLRTYLSARNLYALVRHHLVRQLDILYVPPVLYSLVTLVFRPFQGLKGRLITRACVDSYMKNLFVSSVVGPFRPLFIMPKRRHLTTGFMFIPRMAPEKIVDRVSVLCIDNTDLKTSLMPFTVSANLYD